MKEIYRKNNWILTGDENNAPTVILAVRLDDGHKERIFVRREAIPALIAYLQGKLRGNQHAPPPPDTPSPPRKASQ